jgi:hypothetical protein
MWFDFIQYHLKVVASVMVCRTLFANIKSIKIFVKGKINKNWVYNRSFFLIYSFLTKFIYFICQWSILILTSLCLLKKKKSLHRKICWNLKLLKQTHFELVENKPKLVTTSKARNSLQPNKTIIPIRPWHQVYEIWNLFCHPTCYLESLCVSHFTLLLFK